MRLVYIFVNYNNSDESIKTTESILSANFDNDDLVVIVDNNSLDDNLESLQKFISVTSIKNIKLIISDRNVGYFGGLNLGIDYVVKNEFHFDSMIVGNNDLAFPQNFKEMLVSAGDLLSNYPVISPNIITLNGEHQNPHVIKGISFVRGFIFDICYMNYSFFVLIGLLAKWTRKFTDRDDELKNHIAQEIYQGYGACYILTPLFFKYFERLDNLSFLYYEEFFLSKQLERVNYKVFYEPSIRIVHRLHSSTGMQPKLALWKHARNAHKAHRTLNPLIKLK